ncbi:hypothetical protein D1B33_06900 [Lysinibacillus yapensis]|uniref:Uncharacterized protein n=1 Tax=Ureibacillus yapensis TaxID=2304605 RepID=A0A396SQZ3_9BACL|nr:hypothetical protein [Lysinibacillus yapensis]RHW38599.1 hypothetical protein D1B33_06900 [Lysinibacillus yapensis]
MENVVDVAIPQWFEYDELVVMKKIVNQQDKTTGILLAGDNLEQLRPYKPVVRIYVLTLVNNRFELTKEMGAISFESKECAEDFAANLAKYSAIDFFVDIHKQQIDLAI